MCLFLQVLPVFSCTSASGAAIALEFQRTCDQPAVGHITSDNIFVWVDLLLVEKLSLLAGAFSLFREGGGREIAEPPGPPAISLSAPSICITMFLTEPSPVIDGHHLSSIVTIASVSGVVGVTGPLFHGSVASSGESHTLSTSPDMTLNQYFSIVGSDGSSTLRHVAKAGGKEQLFLSYDQRI